MKEQIKKIFSEDKFKLFVAAVIILLSVTILLNKPNKKDDTEETVYYLEDVADQKLTTDKDLLLPEPSDEAVSEYETYNILEFNNTSLDDKKFTTEIKNTSSFKIKSPSITIFSEDKSTYKEVYLQNKVLNGGQAVSIQEELNEIEKPMILRYSYFLELDGEWRSMIIDLENKAAYGMEEDDIEGLQ